MRRGLVYVQRLISVAPILAALVAAAVALPGSIEAQADDAEAIKSVLVDMWDAIEHGDVDRYAAHVHPDFTSFGENDPYLSEGKAQEVQSVAGWIARTPGVHTEMHQPEVTVRGNTAWITYYWTDGWTNADGTQGGSAGKSTRIFVKEDGRWLCIHGHYTNRPT